MWRYSLDKEAIIGMGYSFFLFPLEYSTEIQQEVSFLLNVIGKPMHGEGEAAG